MGLSQSPACNPDRKSNATTERKKSLQLYYVADQSNTCRPQSSHVAELWHGGICEKHPEPETKRECPLRKVIAQFQLRDDDEKRETLDIPTPVPTPTLPEVMQVIRESWEVGLNDKTLFLFLGLVDLMKRQLNEGGEAGERRHAIEQCIFDDHRMGDAEMNSQVRVIPQQDNSSTMWSEGTDASSAYTVKTVTSFKDQTIDLSGHATRHEKRGSGSLPQRRPPGECLPNNRLTRFERFFTAAARHRISVFFTPRKTG